jgi:HlyD family secretion protein
MVEERKQSDRLWLWLGAGVLLVIVFFAVREFTRERLPVREARVSRQRLENKNSTNGRVEPEVNDEIHSPLSTTVKAVFVHQGDLVPAGKLLLELDDVQARARLASAESGVKAAQAQMDAATHNGTQQERQGAAADLARTRIERDQARTSLDALTKLKSTGAASASEVAAAQERLDTAEAALHAAEESSQSRYAPSDLARAQAALDEAQSNLAAAQDVEARTAPRARIAGTVYSLSAGISEFAEEGKLLAQIADLHHMHVVAYFDEPEIGKLAVGEIAQVRWDGDSKPGRIWQGHIARVPTTVITITGGTRTVGETLVEIDGGDGGLLPDTNVTVTVITSTETDALTIPREALHVENNNPCVFKVVGDSLVRTPVTVGTSSLVLTPILSGLQEGDIVATGTTNGLPLQEGIQIRVVR